MTKSTQPAATTDDDAEEKRRSAALPTDAKAWEMRHTMTVVNGFQRWWDKVPPAKRPMIRTLVQEIVGQRELEEVKP
jgi:hypothetical protein